MTGVFRIIPLRFPRVVKITIGRPVSRRVLARTPPEVSYSATWSRTHCAGLGAYSLSMGMTRLVVNSPDGGVVARRRPAAENWSHTEDFTCDRFRTQQGARRRWSQRCSGECVARSFAIRLGKY